MVFLVVTPGRAALYIMYMTCTYIFLKGRGIRESCSVLCLWRGRYCFQTSLLRKVSWRLVWAPRKEAHLTWGLQDDTTEPKLPHMLSVQVLLLALL